MPRDGRRVGHPFVRLFARRLVAGATIALVATAAFPAVGGRPVLTEQVAGVTSDAAPDAPPSPGGDAPAAGAQTGTVTSAGPQDRAWTDRVPFTERFGAASPASLDGYGWPLPRGRLTLPYGPTEWGTNLVDGDPFHDGIDLATFCGDRIVAAHDGQVLAAGRDYDDVIGWHGDLEPYRRLIEAKHYEGSLPITVVIDDGNGYRSIYGHFSRVTVKVGQQVSAGQIIGYEGATGRASGCHLHYSLFSPQERRAIGVRPDVRMRMHVPPRKTARIDPLLVLPPRKGDPAPLGP